MKSVANWEGQMSDFIPTLPPYKKTRSYSRFHDRSQSYTVYDKTVDKQRLLYRQAVNMLLFYSDSRETINPIKASCNSTLSTLHRNGRNKSESKRVFLWYFPLIGSLCMKIECDTKCPAGLVYAGHLQQRW